MGMGFPACCLDGALYRFCYQDTGVSLSHLATRRARGSADCDLGDPGRCPAKDGHLRHPAGQFPHAAAGHCGPRLLFSWGFGYLEYYLRCALRHGAKGSEKIGGLAAVMPVYTGVTALAFFASMELPGLSGFISEVLVLLGAWQKYPILSILGASGVVLTAGYFLWTIQRVYLGPTNEKYKTLPEINGRELFTLIPLGIIVIILGVYPHAVLDLVRSSLDQINQIVIPHLS